VVQPFAPSLPAERNALSIWIRKPSFLRSGNGPIESAEHRRKRRLWDGHVHFRLPFAKITVTGPSLIRDVIMAKHAGVDVFARAGRERLTTVVELLACSGAASVKPGRCLSVSA
jgi:hypothetical protein